MRRCVPVVQHGGPLRGFAPFTLRARLQRIRGVADPKPTRARALGQTALRTCLWLLLGGWFGSYLFFGAVVAPTAFRVLPSTQLAGDLVGPVLTKLHLFGAFAGIAIALVARALGRGALLVALPVALSAVCLYSHFGLSLEMAEIRALAFGPHTTAEITARFNALHRISLALFVGVGIAVTALIGLHAEADSRPMR